VLAFALRENMSDQAGRGRVPPYLLPTSKRLLSAARYLGGDARHVGGHGLADKRQHE
jgi:hypothetical protein